MPADLSRDLGPSGVLSGTDTSIVPVQLTVERYNNSYTSTGLTVPRYYMFGWVDTILVLSSQGINVLN